MWSENSSVHIENMKDMKRENEMKREILDLVTSSRRKPNFPVIVKELLELVLFSGLPEPGFLKRFNSFSEARKGYSRKAFLCPPFII